MSNIEDRLAASLKYDAINGDSFERTIMAKQIREAIAEIKMLRAIVIAFGEESAK